MLVKLLQSEKAYDPILVTLFEISMLVKVLQSEKAYASMLITPFGISILNKVLQSLNADPPMLVTLFGIFVFLHPIINVLVDVSMIALQLSLLSYTSLLLTTIFSNLLQPINADTSILVTLLGISTLISR